MRKKTVIFIPLILVSTLFCITGRLNTPDKPSDFRDALRDTPAMDTLKSQGQGEDAYIPAAVTPEGIENRVASPEQAAEALTDEETELIHAPTPAQAKATQRLNEGLAKSFAKSIYASRPVEVKYRPYADFEKTGYLLMNSDFNFDSLQAKREMARILPEDALLVIMADNPTAEDKAAILAGYDGAISRDRIRIVSLPDAREGFWARDSVPVPMFDAGKKLTVIDAVYYHGFEADKQISEIFHAGYAKHDYGFEGGNFQANTKGDCLIVDNKRHAAIPNAIFAGYYGCKQVIRLPHVAGIGHVDEVARFVNDTTILTDIPEYKDVLAGKGFTVYMLPRPAQAIETYVNSLIMDGKAVVPVFGQPTDAEALAVYERVGLKATGGNSVKLSNKGKGSVHCITMTYPPVPMADLLKVLKAVEQ